MKNSGEITAVFCCRFILLLLVSCENTIVLYKHKKANLSSTSFMQHFVNTLKILSFPL